MTGITIVPPYGHIFPILHGKKLLRSITLRFVCVKTLVLKLREAFKHAKGLICRPLGVKFKLNTVQIHVKICFHLFRRNSYFL